MGYEVHIQAVVLPASAVLKRSEEFPLGGRAGQLSVDTSSEASAGVPAGRVGAHRDK